MGSSAIGSESFLGLQPSTIPGTLISYSLMGSTYELRRIKG